MTSSGTSLRFVLWAGGAAFVTYLAMYGFRKPFTAATFEGQNLGGWLDFKTALILAQAVGYLLSKIIGIKLIAEMKPQQRGRTILLLVGVAHASLLGFALVPAPYNVLFLFLNGLPLGLIWGLVFSYLEGRSSTEALGALLAVSLIVASGLVKTTALYVMDALGTSPVWMPFVVGCLFAPILFLGVRGLEMIPPPSEADRLARAPRPPMNSQTRRKLLKDYGLGLGLLVLAYIALTILRDFRDNFMVEIWAGLGYTQRPDLLTTVETFIALVILGGLIVLGRLRNNRKAYFMALLLTGIGGAAIVLATLALQLHAFQPIVAMTTIGTGLYIGYILFNTLIFERLIAGFGLVGNIGFLFYIADSLGYLGSFTVLLGRNFWAPDLNWASFFVTACYSIGVAVVVFAAAAILYWRRR